MMVKHVVRNSIIYRVRREEAKKSLMSSWTDFNLKMRQCTPGYQFPSRKPASCLYYRGDGAVLPSETNQLMYGRSRGFSPEKHFNAGYETGKHTGSFV